MSKQTSRYLWAKYLFDSHFLEFRIVLILPHIFHLGKTTEFKEITYWSFYPYNLLMIVSKYVCVLCRDTRATRAAPVQQKK